MDPTTALSTIFSLIPDLLMTSGGQLITGGVYVGGKYITSQTMNGYNFYGGARRRRLSQNKWVKFIKFMRSVFRTFQQPNRFKVAREIFRKLVDNGQIDYAIRFHKLPKSLAERLKEIFVIKPTEKLEKYTWDDARYYIHKGKLVEKPVSELVKLETMPSLSLEHPSAGVFTQLTEQTAEKKAEKEAKKESVVEEIQEAIEKELPKIKDLSKQSQIDALTNLLLDKQNELLKQGNLEAAINKNIVEGATQAVIRNPEFTSPILESLVKFDGNQSMVMDEFRKMYDISRRVLKEITTRLPEQEKPIFTPITEKAIMEPEEGLPRPSQREFFPMKKLSEKTEPSAPPESKEELILREEQEVPESPIKIEESNGENIPPGF
ncbi:MAG: hypothetical protein NZZ41_07505, partial [Candidatus Dojkabacteria bacterium]|nr:hypothetical protein [Candidatus Dojkabacteria bacterium]